MTRKLLLFLPLLIVFFLGWQLYENQIIQVKVSSLQYRYIAMPRKDVKKLTYLFYNMIALDSGGYTLIGNKPMYMGCGIKPLVLSNWDRFCTSASLHNIKIYRAWKAWQKYEHLFANCPFTWKVEINPFWADAYNSTLFILINKNAFNKTVEMHRNDFETVLREKNINGERILQEAKNASLFKTVLKNHDGLIGTLFGFGRNNAWLFEKKKKGEKVSLVPIWDNEIYEFLQNRPDKMCLENLSLVLGYPTFLAEPNTTETETLKREFIAVRQQILDYYKEKDFLEATLALLLEGPPSSQTLSVSPENFSPKNGLSQLSYR